MGKVATQPLPLGGSPPLQSGRQNQRWPTSGHGGYITPAAWGVPTAAQRGAKSEVAHKWARWLHNPCRLGGPHRFIAVGRIGGGRQVGKVACITLPPGGSPRLQSGGLNQRWPTSGQGGYLTPAAWGVPTASEREAESEVAHRWARWLHNPRCLGAPPLQSGGQYHKVAHKWTRWLHKPCRLGGPHRFRARGRITNGPQVGKAAT